MKVVVEDIVSFQSVEQFEECTGLVYEELSDKELFEALEQWWYPSEHDSNEYDSNDINTNFLGYEYECCGEKFLLSRYEQGLVIGLSVIVDKKD